jgi:hypothetical protein
MGEVSSTLHLRLGSGEKRDEHEVADVVSDGFDPINADLRPVEGRED